MHSHKPQHLPVQGERKEEMEQNKELIYERIVQVMKEIGAIGKDSENKIQNFRYRSIDAVMNALQPALIRNRVVMIPEVLSVQRTERVTTTGGVMTFSNVRMRYRFVAVEDGSRIEVVMEGEGMDSGDKSVNKAMSAAYKYACFQTFCIPTEEMKDADAESFETVLPQNISRQDVQYATMQIPQPEQNQAGYPAASEGQVLQPYPQQQMAMGPFFADLSSALNYTCTFGRNNGKTMGQIASEPRSGEELGWYIRVRPDSPEALAANMILKSRVM